VKDQTAVIDDGKVTSWRIVLEVPFLVE